MSLLLMANVACERHGMTIMIDEGRLWLKGPSEFPVSSEVGDGGSAHGYMQQRLRGNRRDGPGKGSSQGETQM